MRDSTAPIVTILIMIFIFVGAVYLQVKAYKRGQIDAINGTIVYHLVEQPNKTMKWERIK